MIDLLDSVTADLESAHLDDAEAVCSVALKTMADDTRSSRLMVLACAREARARALEYLARVQNPDLAHLHVEIAVAHRGVGPHGADTDIEAGALTAGNHAWCDRIHSEIDCEPFSEAEMMLLDRDDSALDADQSRKGRFSTPDRVIQKSGACARECSTRH
jgi:hypothetical protein